jgi:uncharacterized protein (UPF0210 family)
MSFIYKLLSLYMLNKSVCILIITQLNNRNIIQIYDIIKSLTYKITRIGMMYIIKSVLITV